VTEELALREALKRTRLEQAAANPGLAPSRWIIYIMVGGVLLYFRDDLTSHLWMPIALLLLHIHAAVSSVHSRIDAILELDQLNHGRESKGPK
jgi:F0F1-type ATP synthase assembly protein I